MMVLQSFILSTYYLLLVEIIAHYGATQTDRVAHGNNINIRPLSQEHACGPWHYPTDGKCQCYPRDRVLVDWIKCTNESALLLLGKCMTYEEGEETYYVSECPYFQVEGHKVSSSEPGYIELPSNITELNNYMCGPMNRKGHLCSECIDGFGPSFASFGYKCSNCTNSYGVPLYILTELVPLTVFYLMILVFQINLTTSPMTCFIYYSQLVIAVVNIGQNAAISEYFFEVEHLGFAQLSIYGMWNLDFFRYVVPPFCISSKLTLTHIVLIEYISVVYPLCLIIITWICVEMHGRNFRPLVLLWRPFHRCFVKLRREWDTKSDIIDVFCTFLLLSYTRLVLQSLTFIWCQQLLKADNSGNLHSTSVARYDSHLSTCGHTNMSILLIVLVGITLLLCVLPPLLLILYPIKCFRTCLARCRLDLTVTNTFVEKFHSCYRDGLDGRRDMRSCSGLYFLLRFAPIAGMFLYKTHITVWSISNIIYTACAVSIALIKPYKKNYMNILDTLLLSLLAVLCHLLVTSDKQDTTKNTQVSALICLPALMFWIYVTFKLISKVWYKTKKLYKYCGCIRKLKIMRETANTSDVRDSECSQPLIQPSPVTSTVVDLS